VIGDLLHWLDFHGDMKSVDNVGSWVSASLAAGASGFRCRPKSRRRRQSRDTLPAQEHIALDRVTHILIGAGSSEITSAGLAATSPPASGHDKLEVAP
jgi:hypothetical protein